MTHLYGFHDRGGEDLFLAAGLTGWVVVTEAIGGGLDWGSVVLRW